MSVNFGLLHVNPSLGVVGILPNQNTMHDPVYKAIPKI